ncbi:ferrochelatase [Parasulfuritortus cantonensis]|uniref:Ferrochelatase n=1 Tax=Parasulfuritortus cantonensis TaxID=2528202 RepID=A0A4R1BDD9_9PROT|nr:ferrochelatase [Parasulfuritortus cantonensis]TCJ15037.1 ferrochelatase [Parasulfuritortus cantonensis]
MTDFLPEPPFRHDQPSRIGVLLVNLGTPDAPTAPALRAYLKEFLSDRRVVELPRVLWWPILNGIILNTRPAKSAAKYASIWLPGGSPLKVHTEQLTARLAAELGTRLGLPLVVDYAMRYGRPSVAAALTAMREKGCDRILVLPLYPQYAGSTVGTALDAVHRVLLKTRTLPDVRSVRHYHDRPGYIGALRQSVEAYWAEHGRPDILVMSFHGVPRRTLELGDPYHCECLKTGRLLAEALGLAPEQYRITFQSRFGKAEWLRPYTADTLVELGRTGTGRVDAICPGFAADCLETLEEIAMEGKASFLNAGGREFHYIPALNCRPTWVAALADLAEEQLTGWLPDPEQHAGDAERLRERARRAIAAGSPE